MLSGPLRDLQEQIRAAEARVIDSDARLSEDLHRLRHGTSRALTSRVMAGAGLLAAGWLMRGARRRRRSFEHGRRMPWWRAYLPAALHRGLPLLLPLLAPLMNRRVATWLSGFGMPVGPAREAPALLTAPTLDLGRYAGVWHEIARLPRRGDRHGERDVTAHYQLHGDALVAVGRSLDEAGKVQERTGVLRCPNPRDPARMEATHAPQWLRWFPGVWVDHCVIYVDSDYSCALVGTPERDGLWLMAREPHLPDDARSALLTLAARLGYPVARIRFTPQSGAVQAAKGDSTPAG
jgi:apolipoprotein D and lipocalin family protein